MLQWKVIHQYFGKGLQFSLGTISQIFQVDCLKIGVDRVFTDFKRNTVMR